MFDFIEHVTYSSDRLAESLDESYDTYIKLMKIKDPSELSDEDLQTLRSVLFDVRVNSELIAGALRYEKAGTPKKPTLWERIRNK